MDSADWRVAGSCLATHMKVWALMELGNGALEAGAVLYVRDYAECVYVDEDLIDALEACDERWRGRFCGDRGAALDVKQGQGLTCIA